jgi:hypothetical protein
VATVINLGGIDFELPTLAPNPSFNWVQEYVERQMLSGKMRRVYKGRRFSATLTYGYLTDQQVSDLYGLLSSQQQNGYVAASMTTPDGTFAGNVTIDVDESQKRFTLKDGKGVWSNWILTIKGVDLQK